MLTQMQAVCYAMGMALTGVGEDLTPEQVDLMETLPREQWPENLKAAVDKLDAGNPLNRE